VLATVLFFNHTVYWGFLSFAVVGWRSSSGSWSRHASRPSLFSWRDAALQLGAAVLLYVSHALWFAFGVGWLVVYTLAHRVPARVALRRMASIAPVVVAAILWYPHLEALGFVSPTAWFTPPLARLSPEWLVDAVFGGLYGPTEYLLAGILLAWIVAGFWQQRGALRAAVDGDLLWTGPPADRARPAAPRSAYEHDPVCRALGAGGRDPRVVGRAGAGIAGADATSAGVAVVAVFTRRRHWRGCASSATSSRGCRRHWPRCPTDSGSSVWIWCRRAP
jgi:hypothetical protein